MIQNITTSKKQQGLRTGDWGLDTQSALGGLPITVLFASLNSIPCGIIVFDTEGKIIADNQKHWLSDPTLACKDGVDNTNESSNLESKSGNKNGPALPNSQRKNQKGTGSLAVSVAKKMNIEHILQGTGPESMSYNIFNHPTIKENAIDVRLKELLEGKSFEVVLPKCRNTLGKTVVLHLTGIPLVAPPVRNYRKENIEPLRKGKTDQSQGISTGADTTRRNEGLPLILPSQAKESREYKGAKPLCIIGGLLVVDDITRTLKEEEQTRTKKLCYEALFNNSPNAIVTFDNDKKILTANPAFLKLFGSTLSEIQGKNFNQLIVHPERAPELDEVTKQQIVKVKQKDGTLIEATIIRQMRIPIQVEGRIDSVYVCYLTQEPELKNPKQFVEVEKLKTIQELVNGIGHELRSPLTVIRNSTRFLDVALPPEIDSPQANKIRRHLSIIQQEIDAANKLINDLFEFVRIQSPEKVKVTLREIIDDALSFAHIPPTVKVIIDFPKLLPFLFVDRHQIKQALLNLIMHSLSSMLSGGKLIIAAKKQECETDNGNLTTDFLVLTVSDTGIGIPTQPLPKIFHPLFLPKTRGIDLGLIVARSLIQANGGKMSDKNIPGIGTVFTLHLPTTKENQISKMKNDDK